ncbi:major head protein [Erwinia phage vB_EamM_Asesino]|uniref:Major capsid protein n=1 Tax=Erwinia phage vB_EamM_Asesino TaxID=1883370 RepID=A0A1B2IA50_9CAUD|nr:major head protein [Erwinia phage vB_EamM_Asesino]ANZ48104.1 putative major capsid protein [Erwinia phage vB_EamM_Asesino]
MKDTRISNLEKLVNAGNELVANVQSGTSAGEVWSTVVAGESVRKNAKAFSSLNDSAAQQYQTVFPGKSMSHAAQVASAMILGAAGHGMDLVQAVAQESANPKYDKFMPIAIPGAATLAADYGKDPLVAREYYTNKDYDRNLGLTWTLNVRALETQSKFAETLFPTITVETNDVGITVRTKVTTVTRGILNALLTKDVVEDHRQPLHNALSNHKVLQDDAIRIVPYVMETGDNAEYFISSDVVPNETVQLGRVPPYPTNYLTFEKDRLNLFQLAAHPGIVQEGYDETDEIAPGASLGSLLISVRKPSEDVKDGALIKLNVRDMQFATFQRPPEGDGRELTLQFRRTAFSLNAKSLDWKGDDIPALAALAQNQYTLKYSMNISMSLFTNGQYSGRVDVTGKNLIVEGLFDATGNAVDTKSGTGKVIMDGLKLELLGWRFDGTRTNENRRTQGLLLDPIWEQENYKLQYGSPIMTKSPVGVEYDDTERLDDLVSAVNIRNEMLAITQTLSYTEAVKNAFESMITPWDKPAIRGLGRHWVAPWYKESDYNVDQVIQSLDTKDALINARQGLVQRIGDQVTRAIQDSRFMPALRLLTANPDALPKVVIATDEPTAAMLLLTQGDQRLLGDRYEYEVITTNDDRWRIWNAADESWTRRLQWVLKVPTADDGSYCVLNWGNHFWSPIMVTNINIQRNGATSKELAVQPRNAHICHCPITGLIWIKGITKYVESKLAYNVSVEENGTAGTGTGNGGAVGGDTTGGGTGTGTGTGTGA